MKRKMLVVMIVALIVGALMISCNSEVGTNSGSDSLAKVSVSLGSDSKALTATPSSSITPVEELHWYYVATKTDTGLYATGATTWSAVPTTGGTASDGQQMVEGRLLNRFSKGSWSFSFYGYKEETSSKPDVPKNTAVYYAEGIPVNVNGDTSVNVELHTGALDPAKVVFSNVKFNTTGLNINSSASGNFTLQISGLGATITSDEITYSNQTAEYNFKFDEVSSKTVEGLAAGNYTVTFQVLFGGVVVAEEEKNITVSAGTIVTFSGDVLSTDPTHNVVIGNITSTTTATASVNADPVSAITIQNSITPVSSTATSTANVTTVSFPAESLAPASSEEPAVVAVVLEMTVYDTAAAAANSSFTVDSSSASAALDLVLTVGEEPVESFNGKYVAVSTYIATGLQDVTVGTTGEAVVFDSANTNPDASACLSDESTTGTGYNPSTGLLVFKTNHFSSFYVNSSNEAVNITTNVAYATLAGALAAEELADNHTVMLLKDIPSSGILEIKKSITVDGNNKSITTSSVDRIFKVTGETVVIKNVSLTNTYNSQYSRCIDIRGDLKNLMISNVKMEASSSNAQPITISYTDNIPSYKRNIVIENSSITGSNSSYSIIVFCPSEITINNSEISGWSNIYFKNDSNESSVSIKNSSLKATGISGYSNSFGLFVFESHANSVTINNSSIEVSTPSTDAVEAFVSFSEWYGPNTGNTITVDGGSFTLSGGLSRYVTDKGCENSLTITNCDIDNHGESSSSYTYNPGEPEVGYMYVDGNVTKCDGFYILNNLIQLSNESTTPFFTNGEWFELYRDVTLTKNDVFNMNGSGGTFGIKCGDYVFVSSDYKLTIPSGVTIATDKDLSSFFSAPEGYTIVNAESIPTGYTYAYTVESQNQ